MCIHVGSEVLLANLLNDQKYSNIGVSFDDIYDYSEKLKSIFKENHNIKSFYIASNSFELENALSEYKIEFRQFQEKFYINERFNIRLFNKRYNTKVQEILVEALK